MRVLIAEDETTIARALKAMLEHSNYAVDAVQNGNDALDYIRSIHYDALILDIMMPGRDGIDVLKTVRAEGNATPALFLTAKAEIADRVAGLDAGADDYLPKPFAASEFLARVRALVRRSGAYAPSALHLGNCTLDCGQYLIKTEFDEARLNNKEYQLAELFFRHPRQIFSSEHLMEKIWGTDSETEIDVIWTYIGFLRKKLKQIGANVEIRTIRGAGYAMEEKQC